MSRFRSFAATLAVNLAAATLPLAAQTTQAGKMPVLVELFTSEGCSSCPPADALLAKLDHDQPIEGVEVIVLGEHVDYWDGQGWHDRFSSSQYTDRQSQYTERLKAPSNYTPQMVVDGTEQFVGNDASHALRAIQHASQSPKLKLTLSPPKVDGRKVSASVSLTEPPATRPQGDLFAALVDPTDVTEVRGGENGGKKLQHAGVVRSLERVGSLKQLGSGPVSFSLKAPGDAKPETMRLVVFAQPSNQGQVLGATFVNITP
jgi:hypothetical protein